MPSDLKNPQPPVWEQWLLGWIPWILSSLSVLVGAVASPEQLPPILLRSNDKMVHGIEFFLLFWFTVNAFQRVHQLQFPKRLFLTLTYCAVMGVLSEIVQFWAPKRVPSVADFIADAIGFGTAALLFTFFSKKFKSKGEKS